MNDLEKIKSKDNLKLGNSYWVFEPGMNKWHGDFEYLGYNEINGEFVFRRVNFMDKCYFMSVSENDLIDGVCFDYN